MPADEKELKPDPAPRGRSTADARKREERKRNVRSSLIELASLMETAQGRGQVEADDLASIIRRDADAMAETIANMAARMTPVAFLADRVFGAGGPLSVLVSFGPFLRSLVAKARDVRQRQLDEQDPEPEPPAAWEPQPAAE